MVRETRILKEIDDPEEKVTYERQRKKRCKLRNLRIFSVQYFWETASGGCRANEVHEFDSRYDNARKRICSCTLLERRRSCIIL
jgi:hypothetical protein